MTPIHPFDCGCGEPCAPRRLGRILPIVGFAVRAIGWAFLIVGLVALFLIRALRK